MSEEDQKDKPPEGSQSEEGEPSGGLSFPNKERVPAKLAELLKNLSQDLSNQNLAAPQRERIQHTLREVTTYIERKSDQTLNPEIFKTAAATVEKDNENKFKYLTQKEQNAAAKSEREDALEKQRHEDRVRLFWPILIIRVLPI